MTSTSNSSAEPSPDSDQDRWAFSLEEHRSPEQGIGFSLRFLFVVASVFAAVFATIGTISGGWDSRQLFFCVAMIVGWSVLVGVVVFALLSWTRNTRAGLGELLYRSKQIANHGKYKWFAVSSYGCLWSLATSVPMLAALVLFLLWSAFAVAVTQVKGWNHPGLRSLLLESPYIWIQFLLITAAQVWALYAILARPATLEVYEQGFRFEGGGKACWKEVIASRWRSGDTCVLLCNISMPGGGGIVQELPIDIEDRLRVDEIFAQRLDDKHSRLDVEE